MEEYNLPSGIYQGDAADTQQNPVSDKDGIIYQVLGDRLNVLRKILVDISCEIENRRGLAQILVNKIDEDINGLSAKLYEAEMWPLGGNRIIDIRRNEAEEKIVVLEQEKRQRETERWKDIAPLKRELRQTFKEYRDVLRRFNIISKRPEQNE